jgi:hypothetical protein
MMMKRIFLTLTALLLWPGAAFAQITEVTEVTSIGPPAQQSAVYITEYQLSEDKSLVYGVFDLGNKPSVKFIVSSPQGGKLTLQLHGRYYHLPIEHPFSIRASYEDVTGRVFQESDKIVFDPVKQGGSAPKWFNLLDNIAGLYGNQSITLQVPAGTSVVNVMADDETTPVSPNQLMGYISHIKIP